MTDNLNIADDGFVRVKLGEVEKSLDLYRVFNTLATFEQEAVDQFPDADKQESRRQLHYFDRVREYLVGLGFPELSDRAIDQFDAAISKRVDALGKADADALTPA